MKSRRATERAGKPNSVPHLRHRPEGPSHAAATICLGRTVARRLEHPTRNSLRGGPPRGSSKLDHWLPTWACWRWGLPCRARRRTRGALLPHHFTIACERLDGSSREPTRLSISIGCVFSVALSLASLPVAVSHHRALSSSDFPPGFRRTRAAAWPTLSLYWIIRWNAGGWNG